MIIISLDHENYLNYQFNWVVYSDRSHYRDLMPPGCGNFDKGPIISGDTGDPKVVFFWIEIEQEIQMVSQILSPTARRAEGLLHLGCECGVCVVCVWCPTNRAL